MYDHSSVKLYRWRGWRSQATETEKHRKRESGWEQTHSAPQRVVVRGETNRERKLKTEREK